MPDAAGEFASVIRGGMVRAISMLSVTSSVIVATAAHGWYQGPVYAATATRLPEGMFSIA